MEMEMLIPDDMIWDCGQIFDGSYDIEYNHPSPTILDIGANIGCFARWAKYRWPDCTINSYEPLDQCWPYLIKNTASLKNVTCHNVAVGSKTETRKIYYGTVSRGMSSFNKSGMTRDYGTEIDVIAASTLPQSNIVKVDTEGAEIEILENLSFEPDVLLIEHHTISDRKKIQSMYAHTYTMFEYKMMNLNIGTLKFVKNSIIKVI